MLPYLIQISSAAASYYILPDRLPVTILRVLARRGERLVGHIKCLDTVGVLRNKPVRAPHSHDIFAIVIRLSTSRLAMVNSIA
jgi:hypothetical protein